MWIEATIQLQKAHLHLGGHGIVDIFEHLWAIVNDCDFMIGLCALSWLGFQGQIRWLKGNSIYLTRFWHDLCMSEIEFFASQPQYHAMSSSKMLEHQKNRMNKIDETTVFPQSLPVISKAGSFHLQDLEKSDLVELVSRHPTDPVDHARQWAHPTCTAHGLIS